MALVIRLGLVTHSLILVSPRSRLIGIGSLIFNQVNGSSTLLCATKFMRCDVIGPCEVDPICGVGQRATAPVAPNTARIIYGVPPACFGMQQRPYSLRWCRTLASQAGEPGSTPGRATKL